MKEFRSYGRTKSPCFDCENKYEGYHDHCQAFKDYRKKHEEEVEQIRQKRRKLYCTYSFKKNAEFKNEVWKNHKK